MPHARHNTDFGILDRTHLAFFTRKSLQQTLERQSFRILQLKCINADVRFSKSGRSLAYLAMA